MQGKKRRNDTVYTFVAHKDGTLWLWNGGAGGRTRAMSVWESMQAVDGSVRWVATGYRSRTAREAA